MDIISQVEKESKKVKVGTVLIYSDADNYREWKVSEVCPIGFSATCEGQEDVFAFSELQSGWTIKK